jgi:hypothetical protein
LVTPLRWLRDRLARAAGQVRAGVRAVVRSARSLLSRAAGRLGGQIRSRARLIRSLFRATIGADRGFAFWWLVVTAALALAVGLLVALLLTPVLGLLAALIVGIWMLLRGGRSAQARQTATAVS